MSDELMLVTTDEAQHQTVMRIKPWMIMMVALLGIACWAAVSGWIMVHEPTEAERASILNQAQAIAMMAFGYFLGSSAGSRNKDDVA
jgi:hypothetical protein